MDFFPNDDQIGQDEDEARRSADDRQRRTRDIAAALTPVLVEFKRRALDSASTWEFVAGTPEELLARRDFVQPPRSGFRWQRRYDAAVRHNGLVQEENAVRSASIDLRPLGDGGKASYLNRMGRFWSVHSETGSEYNIVTVYPTDEAFAGEYAKLAQYLGAPSSTDEAIVAEVVERLSEAAGWSPKVYRRF